MSEYDDMLEFNEFAHRYAKAYDSLDGVEEAYIARRPNVARAEKLLKLIEALRVEAELAATK